VSGNKSSRRLIGDPQQNVSICLELIPQCELHDARCVKRLVYAPKLFGDCVSDVSRADDPTDCALKRVRLVTLNTSHRNCRL